MACTERCACRTLSQSARGTALSKSFLKLVHPTFWIQQKARRWEGMNNHCCSVWVKTYPCPAEPRLIVRTMGTARAAGRWSGRATAACVCTAAEVSSACMCVWLERRTSAAQSETASSALRVALQPCAVLRGAGGAVASIEECSCRQPCTRITSCKFHFECKFQPRKVRAVAGCTRSVGV